MGQTIAEKILATKSGATRLSPGEIVDAYPDVVMSHTATWRSVAVMKRIGATKLYDPERLAIVLDHVSPAKTEKYAKDQQTSRNFAREYGIKKFYDVDAGIAHLVLMENGHIKPGDLVVGTDSHCTIYGALGALGSGIGYTEVTSVWVTGKLWMKVPTTIKFVLNGKFNPGVSAKDLMLYLIGKLGADGCGYKSAEFYGDAMPEMSISERMTVANLAMEMGSKCVFMPPDAKTVQYLEGRLQDFSQYKPVYADADASLRAARSRSPCRISSRWSPVPTRSRTPSRSAKWSARASTRPSSGPARTASTRTSWWPRRSSPGAASIHGSA